MLRYVGVLCRATLAGARAGRVHDRRDTYDVENGPVVYLRLSEAVASRWPRNERSSSSLAETPKE